MPFTITILGISGDRVTIGVDGEYRGQKMNIDRKTYSMGVGEQFHMTLTTHIEGFGDLPDQSVELEALPAGELSLPYKIDWKS